VGSRDAGLRGAEPVAGYTQAMTPSENALTEQLSQALADDPAEIARDVSAVGRLEAVPTLLEVLCEITGMGFTAVARVTDKTWTLCAVKDEINFGLKPGGQLELETTLCIEAKRSRSAVVIDHASQDPQYRDHHTPRLYRIESYVSVPIVFSNGRYFGNLCAIDPRPAKVMDPKVIGTFQRFARLIAMQLEGELSRENSEIALRDARAAGELREQFMAILGHDLRNPLQAVAMSSALIEKRTSEPGVKELAARISTNVKRMSALIDDILDFARGKLGNGIDIDISDRGDLNAALTEVIRELQDGQPERTMNVDIRVGRPVRCDIGRLQQVTSNLVANALTHGATDRPVSVMAFTEGTDFVLRVSNEGEPIPSEALAKIFEPFWRHSIGRNRQGLGLGLSICSQIIRAHNGTLSVISSRDTGTTFTVRVPS
jgi:signal transduction histidine kinase